VPAQAPRSPRQVSLERTFNAPVERVWELWTTKDGIEAWWGPEGFRVKVHELDPRKGGRLAYAMTATARDQIDFLKKAGMPLTTEVVVTFTDVVPLQLLAFRQGADFIPNVKPYELATEVCFQSSPQGVKMLVRLDAMHDEHWTQMAVAGWESQLGKLSRILQLVTGAAFTGELSP